MVFPPFYNLNVGTAPVSITQVSETVRLTVMMELTKVRSLSSTEFFYEMTSMISGTSACAPNQIACDQCKCVEPADYYTYCADRISNYILL